MSMDWLMVANDNNVEFTKKTHKSAAFQEAV